MDINSEHKNMLLSKFEKIRGFSSDLFHCEDWNAFYYFCIGYDLPKEES
jgi:hypothetical protein